MSSSQIGLCFSLRNSGMILAVIDILLGVYTILQAILALGFGVFFASVVGTDKGTGTDANAKALVDQTNGEKAFEQNDDLMLSIVAAVLYIASAILLVKGAVTITLGSILVHGIRKESASLMKVWIIFRVLILIVEASCDVAKHYIHFSSTGLLVDILIMLAGLWLILIVHELRRDVNNKYRKVGKDTNEKLTLGLDKI